MNQTFDIHRFALILKLDLAEKGKNMLMLATLLIVAVLMMLLPITMSREPSGLREVLHYFALFMVMLLGGSFYSSNALTQYSAPQTCIAALMIPASRFEKFLSSFLLNIIFIAPFLIFFIELHHYTIDIGNQKVPASGYRYNYIHSDALQYFCYSYFLLHSIVFFGSIYFPKASYIRTAVFLLISVVLVFFANVALVSYFTGYPQKLVTFPLTGWKIWESDNLFMIRDGQTRFYNIVFPDHVNYYLRGFAVLLAVSFWFIAYLRLKEKEI
jgi:hypothetical protein